MIHGPAGGLFGCPRVTAGESPASTMTRTVWPGASDASDTPGSAGVAYGAATLEVRSGAVAAVMTYEASKTKTIFIFVVTQDPVALRATPLRN